MVSIKDIAARCGVSVATVSKALNNHSDISETTRTHVRSVADEMGYMPNLAARALKTNRTYNLGVLFVDEMHSGLTHEYFSGVLESFKEEAERRGYDITFINRNIGEKAASYLEHCRYRGVDGLMVANAHFNDPQMLELMASDLPVVTIDHVFNNRTSIFSDNIRGMRELVQYVVGMCHRRLAFIHGERTSVTENRLTSFYKTCYDLNVEVPDAWVLEGVYHDPATCARLTRELLEQPKHPTCIFFPDDFSALGGLNVLAAAGLSVPDDISAVGYDGIYLSQVMAPPLTTYKQDTVRLGTAAAEQLVNLIERPKVTLPVQLLVEGTLLKGKTVRQL